MSSWLRWRSKTPSNTPLYPLEAPEVGRIGDMPQSPTFKPTPQPQVDVRETLRGLPDDVKKVVYARMEEVYASEFARNGGDADAAAAAADSQLQDIVAVTLSERDVARTSAANQPRTIEQLQGEIRQNQRGTVSGEPTVNPSDLGGRSLDPSGRARQPTLRTDEGRSRPTVAEEQQLLIDAARIAREQGNFEQGMLYEAQLEELMAAQPPSDALNRQFMSEEALGQSQFLDSFRNPARTNPQLRPKNQPPGPLGDRVRQATRALEDRAPSLSPDSPAGALLAQMRQGLEYSLAQQPDGSYARTATRSDGPVRLGLDDPDMNAVAIDELARRYGLRPPAGSAEDTIRFFGDLTDMVQAEMIAEPGRTLPMAAEQSPTLANPSPQMRTSASSFGSTGQIMQMSVPEFEILVPTGARTSTGKPVLVPQTIGGGSRLAYFEPLTTSIGGNVETRLVPVEGSAVIRMSRGDDMRRRQSPGGRVTLDAADQTIFLVKKPDGSIVELPVEGDEPRPLAENDVRKLFLQGYEAETANIGSPLSLEDLLQTEAGAEIPGVSDQRPLQTTTTDFTTQNVADQTINPEVVSREIRNLLGPIDRPGDVQQSAFDVTPVAAQRILQLLDDIDLVEPGASVRVLSEANNLTEPSDGVAGQTRALLEAVARGEAAERAGAPGGPLTQRSSAPGFRASVSASENPARYLKDVFASSSDSDVARVVQDIGAYGSRTAKSIVYEAISGRVGPAQNAVQADFQAASAKGSPLAFLALERAARNADSPEIQRLFQDSQGDVQGLLELLSLSLTDEQSSAASKLLEESYQQVLLDTALEVDAAMRGTDPDAGSNVRTETFETEGVGQRYETPDPAISATYDAIDSAQTVADLGRIAIPESTFGETAELVRVPYRPVPVTGEQIADFQREIAAAEQRLLEDPSNTENRGSAAGPGRRINPLTADPQRFIEPNIAESVQLAKEVFAASGDGGSAPLGLSQYGPDTRAGSRAPSDESIAAAMEGIQETQSRLDSQNAIVEQMRAKAADGLAPGADASLSEALRVAAALEQELTQKVKRFSRLDITGDSAAQMRREQIMEYLGVRQEPMAAEGDAAPAWQLEQLLSAEPVAKRNSRPGFSNVSSRDRMFESIFGSESSSASSFLSMLDPDVPASQVARDPVRAQQLDQLKQRVRANGGLEVIVRDIIENYAGADGSNSVTINNLQSFTDDMLRAYRDSVETGRVDPKYPEIDVDIDNPELQRIADRLSELTQATREGRIPDTFRQEIDGTRNLLSGLRRSGVDNESIRPLERAVEELATEYGVATGERPLPSTSAPRQAPVSRPEPVTSPRSQGLRSVVIEDAELDRMLRDGEVRIADEDIPEFNQALVGDLFAGKEASARLQAQRESLLDQVDEAESRGDLEGIVSLNRELAIINKEIENRNAQLYTNFQSASANNSPIAFLARERAAKDVKSPKVSPKVSPEVKSFLQGSQEDMQGFVDSLRLSLTDEQADQALNLLEQAYQKLRTDADADLSRAPYSDDKTRMRLAYDDDGSAYIQVFRNTAGSGPRKTRTASTRYYLMEDDPGTSRIEAVDGGVQVVTRDMEASRRQEVQEGRQRRRAVDRERKESIRAMEQRSAPQSTSDAEGNRVRLAAEAVSEASPDVSVRPTEEPAVTSQVRTEEDAVSESPPRAEEEPTAVEGSPSQNSGNKEPTEAKAEKPRRRLLTKKRVAGAAAVGAAAVGAGAYGPGFYENDQSTVGGRIRRLIEGTPAGALPVFMSSARGAELGGISDTNTAENEAPSSEERALSRLQQTKYQVPRNYFTYRNPLPN